MSQILVQQQIQIQNPCDFCEDNAEEMGLEIQEAEFIFEDTCLGIKICMELCREHYLEAKAMKYEADN